MFKLESNRLKREFKVANGNNFYASQILNKYSDMSFVPDGNGNEFEIHFADGSEFSSKGLGVTDSFTKDDKMTFVFEENMGTIVTLSYWVHNDKNSICKQISIKQNDNKIIDYILLENIGIVNSKTHFGVDLMQDSEISGIYASLGQPFYIDSLFFGCEFPATDNRIVHGAGQIKYFVGKNCNNETLCPITVIGGAKDNTIVEVKKAFFEYIDFISQNIDLRFQYNSWFDHMQKIDENIIKNSFSEIAKGLAFHDAPKLGTYVIDDGWQSPKANFWQVNNKKFPNGLESISKQCKEKGTTFGMWISPRGGYSNPKKFAKKIEKGNNGYLNKNGEEICVASSKYIDNFTNFVIEQCEKLDLSYLKFDGFCFKPCENENHDHAVGGENNMYFVTDMWHKWINAFERIRKSRNDEGKDLWINMTCYTNVSPWWLQWVNSIWLQNSLDIGFAENHEEQPQVEAEITYRDSRYYDCICERANQIPLKAIYNHEPIYAHTANLEYTDEEFEKYIYWCAIRGQALNELYMSYDMMSDEKWDALAGAMNFQKDNYHILKNASFIGGDPNENNIYGYVSWSDSEGVIALRNPTKEPADLTLNINKLMGAPEDLKDVKMVNIYCKSISEDDKKYSYGAKIDLTIKPFEIIILKFTK